MKSYICPLLSAAALLASCGEAASSRDISTLVALPLSLQTLPWDDAASQLDVSFLAVRTGDPTPMMEGTGSIAWSAPVSVASGGCAVANGQRHCQLTVPNLETKDLTRGLLVETVDSRQAYSATAWQGLSTLLSQATVLALRGPTASATTAAPVAIMSTSGTAKLARWSGVSQVDILNQGGLLGLIADPFQLPVLGAHIAGSGPQLSLVYASSDFSAAVQPSDDRATPYFLATGGGRGKVEEKTWAVGAPAQSRETWSVPWAGVWPNRLIFIALLATPS